MEPQQLQYLNQCYDLLPPFFREVDRKGSTVYLNEVTGEVNSTHPLNRFKELLLKSSESSSEERSSTEDVHESALESQIPTSDLNTGVEHNENENAYEVPLSETADKVESEQNLLEYHCQWKERNAFGQMGMYGMTLRFDPDSGNTSIRFDGVVNSDWTFTALKGPYGALEPHDLYVGARIQVFGRHLTISSANSTAVRWIEKESKRLTMLQAKFRKRIESIGQKPVVVALKPEVVRHVERENKKAGQINLRKLVNEVGKLGEQLAQLGLAEFALS